MDIFGELRLSWRLLMCIVLVVRECPCFGHAVCCVMVTELPSCECVVCSIYLCIVRIVEAMMRFWYPVDVRKIPL